MLLPRRLRSQRPIPTTRRSRVDPLVLPLEPRCLLSVSAASLVGPQNAGFVVTQNVLNNGAVEFASTFTIKGAATFNGYSCTEVDESDSVDQNTGKEYYGYDSSGDYVMYGLVENNNNSVIGNFVVTDTNSPPELQFPPSMNPGQTYNSTFTSTNSSTATGSLTSSQAVTITVELLSASTTSITVPAGTFNCYEVEDTTSSTVDGQTNTNSFIQYDCPSVGDVEETNVGSNQPTQELVSYSGASSTGGSGSTGTGGGTTGTGGGTTTTNTSTLVPTIARSTLPASVIAGGTSRGEAVVDLHNSGTTQTGNATVDVYASSDGSIDSSATLVGTVTRRVSIRAGATLPVTVPIKSLPATLDGTYTLLAQVTDPSGNTATTSSGPTLTAAARFISFSDTLVKTTLAPSDVSGQKTRAVAELKITNNGNITSSGESTAALYASINTTPTDGTLIRSLTEPIVLKPGAARVVMIPLLALPDVPNNAYFIDAQVTDPKGNLTTAASAGTYALATPFVSLVPSAASVAMAKNGSATVSFTVTNNGNITPSGLSTIELAVSSNGTVAATEPVVTEHQALPLAAGAHRLVRMKLTAAQVSSLQAGNGAFVILTDSTGGVQSLALTGL